MSRLLYINVFRDICTDVVIQALWPREFQVVRACDSLRWLDFQGREGSFVRTSIDIYMNAFACGACTYSFRE